MAKLRAPGGCPWDREQTHKSIRRHLVEETYEVLEAIDNDDFEALKDELGDLLLQVLFHAQIASEENKFNIEEVLNKLSDKLIRRHPHIFADTEVSSAEEVVKNWEEIKKREAERPTRLAGIPKSLPLLLVSYKLQEKAARAGFDWEKPEDIYKKIDEEIEEVKQAVEEKGNIEHEIGDVLFAVVNLARRLGVDPESAMRRSNERFVKRFGHLEEKAGKKGKILESMGLDEMDSIWEQIKKEEKGE